MARSKSFGTFGLIAVLLGVLIVVPFILRQSRIFEGFGVRLAVGFEQCGTRQCTPSQYCQEAGFCESKLQNGADCSENKQCISNKCVAATGMNKKKCNA